MYSLARSARSARIDSKYFRKYDINVLLETVSKRRDSRSGTNTRGASPRRARPPRLLPPSSSSRKKSTLGTSRAIAAASPPGPPPSPPFASPSGPRAPPPRSLARGPTAASRARAPPPRRARRRRRARRPRVARETRPGDASPLAPPPPSRRRRWRPRRASGPPRAPRPPRPPPGTRPRPPTRRTRRAPRAPRGASIREARSGRRRRPPRASRATFVVVPGSELELESSSRLDDPALSWAPNPSSPPPNAPAAAFSAFSIASRVTRISSSSGFAHAASHSAGSRSVSRMNRYCTGGSHHRRALAWKYFTSSRNASESRRSSTMTQSRVVITQCITFGGESRGYPPASRGATQNVGGERSDFDSDARVPGSDPAGPARDPAGPPLEPLDPRASSPSSSPRSFRATSASASTSNGRLFSSSTLGTTCAGVSNRSNAHCLVVLFISRSCAIHSYASRGANTKSFTTGFPPGPIKPGGLGRAAPRRAVDDSPSSTGKPTWNTNSPQSSRCHHVNAPAAESRVARSRGTPTPPPGAEGAEGGAVVGVSSRPGSGSGSGSVSGRFGSGFGSGSKSSGKGHRRNRGSVGTPPRSSASRWNICRLRGSGASTTSAKE